jgi:chromosomal replication initiation ATPase DnaA
MTDDQILDIIVEIVCRESDIDPKHVLYMNRTPRVCKVRDTICYLARQRTKLSLPQIGKKFFGRHHTTILSCVRNEEARLSRQLPLRSDGRTLKEWHELLLQLVNAELARLRAVEIVAAGVVAEKEKPDA